MYTREMKPVIIKAMNYKIKNLSTYKGYDGADILKFTFHDNKELLVIRDFCKELKIETNIKLNDCVELYCVFEAPDDIYPLKFDL